MAGLIDLNTTEDDEAPSSNSSATTSSASAAVGLDSSPSPSPPSSSTTSVCLELWHACAGPLISLPKKGSVVVYLPQGHLEHVSEFPASSLFDLPPHLFCRVTDVKLHVSSP